MSSLAKWYITDAIRDDPDELKRAKLIGRMAFAISNFSVGFSPILFLVDAPVLAVYNLVISIMIGATPLVIRLTGSAVAACHTLVALIVMLLAGLAAMQGGLETPTTPVLIFAPMVAVLLLQRSAGIIWTVVVGLVMVSMVAVEALGYQLPEMVSPDAQVLLRMGSYLAMLVITLLFLWYYDSDRKAALEVVNSANNRMTAMIAHVEATSAALSRSAAEFLGSESMGHVDDERKGLTREMMSSANSGRKMLDEVNDSLRGMIKQYHQISGRIQDLHKQSGTIADLVRTITNISSRLDLMALNTGIEATHAGASGKRFQLLADDMRRLAERVSLESSRIKDAISLVETHTNAALQASLVGQSLTDEGSHRLESMAMRFDEIYLLIERTAEASKRITQDTEVQIEAIHRLASASQTT